eukprot:1158855-Pelagomonas_calceolata.AAC.9
MGMWVQRWMGIDCMQRVAGVEHAEGCGSGACIGCVEYDVTFVRHYVQDWSMKDIAEARHGGYCRDYMQEECGTLQTLHAGKEGPVRGPCTRDADAINDCAALVREA